MSYMQRVWFRTIVHIVLGVFYLQTLNPALLGYAPLYGAPPTRMETTGPSAWQRLLDFMLPTAQAAELAKTTTQSSAVFRYREYVPAYAQPQATNDPLLMSTPEFDLADPYLVEKADELGRDPQRIFAFVRDEIGFESYTGSLRGARGALWSKAGNALDKASLMIALLRISGVPARYVQGTLSDADAKTLIASMFDPVLMAQAVGYIPDEYPKADPVNDPTLLAETRDHWWVELGNATPFDPNFKDGAIHGTRLTNYAEVPDNLRHKVTIRLKTEFNNALSGFTEQIPLQKTLTTAEVYGKPLSISHFVNENEVTGLIGAGYKTFTYSPYIMVDDNDASIDNDEIIRGSDYQEFFSGLFPIANSIITRVTLEMEIMNPQKTPEIYSRDFVDRVGFPARHGLSQIGIINQKYPVINSFDVITINIISGMANESLMEAQFGSFINVNGFDLIGLAEPMLGKDPLSFTEQDDDLLDKLNDYLKMQDIAKTRLVATTYLLTADEFSKIISKNHIVKFYHNSPRIILSSDLYENNESDLIENKFYIDLRKDNIRALAISSQNSETSITAKMWRGLINNLAETEAIKTFWSGFDSNNSVLSTFKVFEEAQKNGVEITTLYGQKDISNRLDGSSLSAESKARISKALLSGKAITVPLKMVIINSKITIGWYENNPQTGELIGIMEDGGHQALAEYTTILRNRVQTGTLLARQLAIRFTNLAIRNLKLIKELVWNTYKSIPDDWKPSPAKIIKNVIEECVKGVVEGVVEGLVDAGIDAIEEEIIDAFKEDIRDRLNKEFDGLGDVFIKNLEGPLNASDYPQIPTYC